MPYRIFVIESGPLLEKANDFRARYQAVHDAWKAWMGKHYPGSERFYTSEQGRFMGMAWYGGPLPEGWRRFKERIIPRKANKEAYRSMEELPILPANSALVGSEADEWLEIAPSDDGLGSCVTFSGVTAIALRCHSAWNEGRLLKAAMTFPVPGGCREVSEVQWNWMLQEARRVDSKTV